jgi:hypothetical protein
MRNPRLVRSIVLWSVAATLATLGGIWVLHSTREAELRSQVEAQCIADSERIVAEYLRENTRSSAKLGAFQQLSGKGYGGPGLSPAGFFLQALRIAHFTNGDEEIRIYVFPRHPTHPNKIHVYLVEGNHYLVSHPSLTAR